MKTIKLCALVALLAVSATASAQFANGGKSSASSVSSDGWQYIWAEWNPSTFKVDAKGADDQSFTGLSLGYTKAFGLSKSMPLFLEAGLGLQYSFYSEDADDDEYGDYITAENKFSGISLRVPVNLTYAWDIPNSTVTLAPFVGLHLRFNISGKLKTEFSTTAKLDELLAANNIDPDDYLEDSGYESSDRDVFDKKDMGSSDATWNRFQIGWQIGLKAHFNKKFLVGISYGSDFSELAKKTKISQTSITLGYMF